MKNLKLILTVITALLFAGIVSSYGQDTSSRSSQDSMEMKIENAEKEIGEIARKLEILLSKLGEKTSREIEEEVTREIKEAMKELEEELEDLNQELDEDQREMKEERREKQQELEERQREIEEEARELKVEIEEEQRKMEEEARAESEGDLGDVLEGIDIKWNKKKDKLANVKTRWLLVDLGFASYVTDHTLPEIEGINPMETDLINSISWRLHLVNQRINLIRHHVNLVYGAGFSFNFYGFSHPVTLTPSSPNVNFTLAEGNDVSYKKNHLRAAYLHLPLMLNIETNPHQKSKSFHINAGVYGNVLLGGKTSQKTNNGKSKIKNKYNMQDFQYGLIGQFGYGPVTFYGTYGLNELFNPDKDNGYTVTPITFGIKVIPF